jgi:hypothetical protein
MSNDVKVEIQSPSKELNSNDWKKIAKGAGIAVAGTVLTYAAEIIPGINFGEYQLLIAPILMVLINLGLKWYEGQPKQ